MKKIVFIKILVVVLIQVISSCAKNGVLNIVKDGGSNYEIVFSGDITESQYKSAEVLQTYIQKISALRLPIIKESNQDETKDKIYIGYTNGEDLGEHQISLHAENKNLFISGGSDDAIRNAVYEFLERYLNCKWYAPNVEDIPSLETIALDGDLNYSYTPEITTRTVHSRLFYDNENFAAKHKVTTEAFPYYVPNARVHTFHRFLPEETYYKDHPEYFALRGDKRLPTQLCLTNDAVYEIVKASVAELFEQNPETTVVSVSQNDNQQYCTCEHCKKIDDDEGGQAGTMIQFVNRIAADFPAKTISTLAYQYTRTPSKTKPLKNVLITLCSIECDRSAPIENKCLDFAEDIRGWREITNNIRIWDYTTQFTNFLAVFPNIHTLQPNIKFFRDNHAKWVFEQHSNNPSELFELRSYIMAKLLWNPDLDVDGLITEFTDGYYQEAGAFVKQYVNLVHMKIQEYSDFFLFLYGDPSQAFDSYLNPELLHTYNDYFDVAEKAVAHKPEILQRVKVARLSIDYAILEACKKNLSEAFSMTLIDESGHKVINKSVIDRLEKFYNTSNNANITLMNEMGFTVSEYYENYKKAIEVAEKPNKAKGKKVSLLTKPKKYANEDPQTLTDGALGGSNFYANWLGFEGNHMEAVIDLNEIQEISSISTAFLQVSNHIVFFPESVSYYYSNDNIHFIKAGTVENDQPLTKTSKVNDIKYFDLKFSKRKARYIKIVGKNMNEAPYWHHAAGLPTWVFADEVLIN